MLQAALLDGPFLAPLPFSEDGFVACEVDVGGCDVVQALGVALVVIVFDEGPDLTFKVASQVIVCQQNTVLHRLMPAFYFALGLRVGWRTADMLYALRLQPFGQSAARIKCRIHWLRGIAVRRLTPLFRMLHWK